MKTCGRAAVWNMEVIPILGYRLDRCILSPIRGLIRLSGRFWPVNYQPAAKIAYRAFAKNDFGIEYYVDAGPLRNRLPRDEQSRCSM